MKPSHLFCWAPAAWSAVTRRSPDEDQLRAETARLYARVATEPGGDFHFHRGPEYAATRLGYDPALLATLPAGATASFAGVGNPHAIDALKPGETVLDIGSGSGTDLLIAARAVGSGGRAIGVEMTPEMRERCTAAITGTNAEVLAGDAENLPVDDASIDTVISNGVLNLVPDKPRALAEIHRVLRPGGRLMLGDIALTSSLGRYLKSSVDLWALCVGGAIRERDTLALVTAAGFENARITQRFDCITGTSSETLARMLGVHGINLYATKPGGA